MAMNIKLLGALAALTLLGACGSGSDTAGAAGGVASARISTISYGKDRPAALGSDQTAWSQNRRAVTVVR